jgi:hypothetical protein
MVCTGARSPVAIGELTPATPATYGTPMPRKVVITGPAPSLEETAREVGLSPGEARRIADLMDAIVQRRLRRAGGVERYKRGPGPEPRRRPKRVAGAVRT